MNVRNKFPLALSATKAVLRQAQDERVEQIPYERGGQISARSECEKAVLRQAQDERGKNNIFTYFRSP